MYSSAKNIKIPPVLKKMHEIFSRGGFRSYLVGGAVRDILMGLPPHDYDVATDAKPEDVMRLFHRVIPTGIAHIPTALPMRRRSKTTFRGGTLR